MNYKFLCFLGFLLVLCHGVSSFKCSGARSPNCFCVPDPEGGRYSITCMKKNDPPVALFDLSYVPDNYLKIVCNKDEDDSSLVWKSENYEYLNELKFGDVNIIHFRSCPPPKKSFAEIGKSMGIHTFDKFIYQSGINLETGFDAKLFKNMSFVTKLKLDSNGFTDLPVELLIDQKNLTSIDLMLNNLNLSSNFFIHSKNLTFITLGSNGLTGIPDGLFRGLDNLKQLNLENNKLKSLTTEFVGLKKLELLDVSNNGLIDLHKEVFSGLSQLQNVSLASNSFTELPENLFRDNKNLKKLVFSKNQELKSLPKIFLQNASSLVEIYFDYCAIDSIEPDAFSNLTAVNTLDLSGNKLTNLSAMLFRDAVNLEVLDLASNSLSVLPVGIFKNNSRLLTLDLSRNKITTLSEDHLQGLSKLKVLRLSGNVLSDLSDNTFKVTPSLEEIYLSGNELTLKSSKTDDQYDYFYEDIDRVSMFRFIQRTLRILDLSNNKIKEIPADWEQFEVLEKLDLSRNHLHHVDFQALTIQTNVPLQIHLTHNQIETLNFRLAMLLDEQNQRNSTSKKPRTIVHIDNNPFACDCVMFDVVQYINRESKQFRRSLDIRTDNATCAKPANLAGQLIRKVDKNLLVCEYPEKDCSEGCECFVRPVDKAVIVNCSGANLTHLPTQLPQLGFTKTELHLENNRIQNVEDLDQRMYENVSLVNLEDNNLTSLVLLQLPTNLAVLRLNNNKLETIGPESFSVILKAMNRTSLNISLSGNPWKCRCDTRHLMEMLTMFQNVLDLGQVQCTNLRDNPQLITVSVDDFCPAMPGSLIAGMSFALLIIVIAIASSLILYYKNQRVVKAWLYSKGWFLSWVSEEEVDKNKIYDAFVSFSNEDEEFVIRELVPKLENLEPCYKLCLHSRDWPAGEYITDNIYSSVQNSKRTVVLLTSNYLNSSWCLSEFQTAYQYAIEENTRRLILIVQGELPPMNHLPKDLRTYITTNTYLRADDQWFWNKLRYSLPHKTVLGKMKPKSRRFDFLTQKAGKEAFATNLQLTPTTKPANLSMVSNNTNVSELEENRGYGVLV